MVCVDELGHISPRNAMTTDDSTPSMLEAHDLSVRYGETTAVDHVDLSARAGEILGLLGPNGAGKTSVIRALTTVVPIASGSASVAGRPLTDTAGVRSHIGVLPESNGYPGGQTAVAYLRYFGQLFGYSRTDAEQRARRLLDRMGLGGNADVISTFSRGMRQRLGLARALINDPAVIFLDEPTLGLDPAGKEDILMQLTRVAVEEGACVVLCSHLLDEVERVCDRVAIMHRARIVAEGSVEEVVDAAGVGGHGRVQVSAHDVAAADLTLTGLTSVLDTRFDNTRPGDIDVDLAATPGAASDVLRSLLDAGIEPRSFDLRGARLSDAFLALTGDRREAVS
jgi:ABC-2 type transport system ATP-binding protein